MTTYKKPDLKAQARNGRINTAKARGKPAADALPPNSEEAERGALGCVLLAAADGAMPEVDALLMQLRPAHFFDLRHRGVFEAMRALRIENHAVDVITLRQWLSDKGELEGIGGVGYLAALPDATPSAFNFPHYLGILKDKSQRRFLTRTSGELATLAGAADVTLEDIKARLSELMDSTAKATNGRAGLKMWRPSELMQWQPNPKTFLVGDNEIRTGYDGLTVIGGPGSSGKSQMVAALALAACRGSGTWQGRKVHRQFRVFILQAENGAFRLKREIEAMLKNHPELNLEEHVRISDPPEGGIAFDSADFRSALRREIEKFKPDLVVIDPWSAVACEDSAKEVVEKLVQIRSGFPGGDDCPGLLIVAHTNKPRADVVRKGRGLMYLVSGSIALVNTARCVYVLLPWSDDIEDDRIYWACPKLNDGANYAPTVWHRRFGGFPVHDDETDPTTWGDDGEEERRVITEGMVREVFKKTKRPGMKRSELIRLLVEYNPTVASSTAWRAFGKDGYGKEWVDEVAGVVALKRGVEK